MFNLSWNANGKCIDIWNWRRTTAQGRRYIPATHKAGLLYQPAAVEPADDGLLSHREAKADLMTRHTQRDRLRWRCLEQLSPPLIHHTSRNHPGHKRRRQLIVATPIQGQPLQWRAGATGVILCMLFSVYARVYLKNIKLKKHRHTFTHWHTRNIIHKIQDETTILFYLTYISSFFFFIYLFIYFFFSNE